MATYSGRIGINMVSVHLVLKSHVQSDIGCEQTLLAEAILGSKISVTNHPLRTKLRFWQFTEPESGVILSMSIRPYNLMYACKYRFTAMQY